LDADWILGDMAHSYNMEKIYGWVGFFRFSMFLYSYSFKL